MGLGRYGVFMVSTLAKGETEGRDDASIVFGQFFHPLVLYICELRVSTQQLRTRWSLSSHGIHPFHLNTCQTKEHTLGLLFVGLQPTILLLNHWVSRRIWHVSFLCWNRVIQCLFWAIFYFCNPYGSVCELRIHSFLTPFNLSADTVQSEDEELFIFCPSFKLLHARSLLMVVVQTTLHCYYY